MTEAVEILIKADDQASQKFAATAENMDKSLKRVNQILTGLEEPADKYAKQLEELNQLHRDGAISAQQFAAAQEKISSKMNNTGAAMKDMGGHTKKTTELVGTLAQLTGNSELSSFASQLAGATEKISSFAEVSKAGKAGALAFKLGLIGLAASAGAAVGKALGDIIFETKKFTREFDRAKQASKDFEESLKKTRSTMMDNAKEDIELIRDPEKKRAAYRALLGTLDKDIKTVSDNVKVSQKAVDDWADAWQITEERKETALQATEQLENDKARLSALREERDELQKISSERRRQIEEIEKANEAKDKSEAFISSLKEEIEYLAATKDEQLKLEAARNTTVEDRGEAERLLKERDAILAKAEAQKELEEAQKRAEEERAKAAEKAIQDAEREKERIAGIIQTEQQRNQLRAIELEQGKEAAKIQGLINQGIEAAAAKQLAAAEAALQAKEDKSKAEEQRAQDAAKEDQRIKDLVKSEEERLALRKIEIEQGKEAAKIQGLINQGVDEVTAKKLAAAEAALEKDKGPIEQPKDPGAVQAKESRLLTRGEGGGPFDKMNQQFAGLKQELAKQNAVQTQQLQAQQKIAENTAKGSKLVTVS